MKKRIFIFLGLVVTFLVLVFGKNIMAKKEIRQFSYNKKVLRTGDLIFVRGTSWQSSIVLLTDMSNQFSHLGVVWKHDDELSVIHAVPNSYGESDMEGVVIEPLHTFLSPEHITDAEAYRVKKKSDSLLSAVIAFAKEYAQEEVPFDFDFDFSSDKKLYCTEFIWRIFNKSGIILMPREKIKGILMPSQISNSSSVSKIPTFALTSHR